jgi:hypothetical protein
MSILKKTARIRMLLLVAVIIMILLAATAYTD